MIKPLNERTHLFKDQYVTVELLSGEVLQVPRTFIEGNFFRKSDFHLRRKRVPNSPTKILKPMLPVCEATSTRYRSIPVEVAAEFDTLMTKLTQSRK